MSEDESLRPRATDEAADATIVADEAADATIAADEADSAGPADESVDAPDTADAGPGELTEAQLEALLFVAERPLSRSEIAHLAGVDAETVDALLGDLTYSLERRGIRLVESGERVELATAPEAGALIARYVGADAPRLSMPSLETLAIIAYRQPCTRATIERIRGVDTDYTLRTLLHRRLIVELGRSEAPGRPILYGTGFDFLERFGLTSLEQLPPLEADVAARVFAVEDEAGGPAGSGEGGDTAGSVDREPENRSNGRSNHRQTPGGSHFGDE